MTQVDYIDYGLGWETLKRGQKGDTICFEIVDFEAITPLEQIKLEKRWAKEIERQEMEDNRKRAKHKMRKRIERIIIGSNLKKYYWLPKMNHGRNVLALLSNIGYNSLSTLEARLGLYLFSILQSWCLIRQSFS